jgi:alpha-ketoglutarate-dependent taurine dioxygenase
MDSLSIRQAVVNHYTTLKPIFRLTISGKDVLRKFDNREPLEREIKLFEEIQEWTIKEITQNTSNQYWHRWDVGDTLIVDLSLMAHAVTGGFNLGERFFSRIWAHKYDF